ncbi:MAG TPA: bifunctional 4-hydroxy-2-oxoglutarate aldolase/2-dehydro-3-deoxy-phosphogluconate aldolase [Spirochaetota bacterium]|nr:bifunctional 4-hydroxy-2-oxoglutarate aldolase/2-dehydro-3-deoxy-phosphogluconate aldolase [Spirochaetota bacterium]HPI88707.1 bifunctional 4-hydroxy-2-oxoglutarate aldolase/2-dehydro-3-deoxy-phosphogluconate aldolase [Spirochaetota bacterium]HPR48771.1 bifunctional 4-hydroxy-2-oxoglutarate aldolase/2-dehydro-3-deoxy-phosphogluconate aldolase [Spirochaetota bacterium]
MDIVQTLARSKIVPVAVFNNVDAALKTAELLLEHSIFLLEVTMRTPAAPECLKRVSREFPDLCVGAGSILDVDSLDRSLDAGALFGVAPGLDEEVVDRAVSRGLPFVPGVATPSELNRALKKCRVIKVFPAQVMGGPDFIQAIAAPFKMKGFHLMPTGGINEKNYLQYLAVDRVIACGMTYIVDGKLIEKGDYPALKVRMEEIARGLAAIKTGG